MKSSLPNKGAYTWWGQGYNDLHLVDLLFSLALSKRAGSYNSCYYDCKGYSAKRIEETLFQGVTIYFYASTHNYCSPEGPFHLGIVLCFTILHLCKPTFCQCCTFANLHFTIFHSCPFDTATWLWFWITCQPNAQRYIIATRTITLSDTTMWQCPNYSLAIEALFILCETVNSSVYMVTVQYCIIVL